MRRSFSLGVLVIGGLVVLAQLSTGCASTGDQPETIATEPSARQSPDVESQLRELRINPREVHEAGIFGSLSGRGTPADSAHLPRTASDDSMDSGAHLSGSEVLPVLTTYREIFKEPRLDPATGQQATDPATGERLYVDRDREIRGSLTGALRRFRGENSVGSGGTLDAVEFRRFLENTSEESVALGHVQALQKFFRQLHLLGLGPKVEEKCRRTNLARVCPNGLRVQQLEEIILARPDETPVSMLR